MNIFDNDSEVLQIGALTIENGTGSVILSGDVEITKTQAGKAQAQALFDFAQALCAVFDDLDSQGLPATADKDPSKVVMVNNPFE
ncbi:hypothetical protein LP123_12685 [Moraxella bovis]|uniref:Uncharacterized protein n=1 Tax=Moraxella bovis TaxID=476 RepID=A0AAQ2QAD0_MORBO|nr:hypothetical protein [Moraxella bovis]AWY19352.1 hypothetical protein DQF64_01650 [Moraxella bovis]UYZ68159.1 hypothetical protein LP122_10405 [Moraxella bovis]UYZ70541.1 hypothetical protein LP089_10560 [Moraxella bovis]UYZ73539.1 hypothetical protein LP105_02115 [Moraxella bovis]UYZ76060.1 hypothetical protein LP093_01620 [Moraxella bovis]